MNTKKETYGTTLLDGRIKNGKCEGLMQNWFSTKSCALTVNRTRDLQIFSLTLSQLSYQSCAMEIGLKIKHQLINPVDPKFPGTGFGAKI